MIRPVFSEIPIPPRPRFLVVVQEEQAARMHARECCCCCCKKPLANKEALCAVCGRQICEGPACCFAFDPPDGIIRPDTKHICALCAELPDDVQDMVYQFRVALNRG